jgi:hypothetical protein
MEKKEHRICPIVTFQEKLIPEKSVIEVYIH